MDYRLFLITGDVKLSSAQGVRYTALYSNKSAVGNDVNLVYSSSSDKLDGGKLIPLGK